MNTAYQPDAGVSATQRRPVLAYLTTAGLLLLLMMVVGVLLRMSQAEILVMSPDWFYRFMTLHGAGMVGMAGLAGAGIMLYFLGRHVSLSTRVAWINLVFFVVGVVLILVGITVGDYAGAWTFLYPLPRQSMGVWTTWGAAAFLGGLLLIGVGFLLLHLDTGRAILSRYKGLGRALGWPQLFGPSQADAPPPAVVASTMVLIVNTLALILGASIIVVNLISLFAPEMRFDPLVAKNLTYFFGHVFINATIYMSVIAVYELLPRYTGRDWPSNNRAFLGAWTVSTLMVLGAFPHHLLMDFVQPVWISVAGQIVSYISGLPVLVVTAYGALVNVHRSGIRWDLPSGLLFLSTFGWAAGIVPAMIDATISVNMVMHNTLWVPGHFHFYLLLGMCAMALGFMLWFVRAWGGAKPIRWECVWFWVYALGCLSFVTMFLLGGRSGVPRRFAAHQAAWLPLDKIASVCGLVILLSVSLFVTRFVLAARSAARGSGQA
ncbi:MAG: cytochrome c oxidase subunit I [Leptolyngbya sp. PLA3]|nr:MAG: cytochrome C oxidase subunit I [Cyanobacteria bacterium CYA]MCE7969386.1 cytochrome c oxidase subunit I [Leptolyngbya sp. PL-A3]